MNGYKPNPIDTSDVKLDKDIYALGEIIAENVHDVWAKNRISEGWRYGTERDDLQKQTPCLVPYSELPDEEKEYDRKTAMETLRLIIKLGYSITKES